MSLEDHNDLALGGREWKLTRGPRGEGREGGKILPSSRPHSRPFQGEKSVCEGIPQPVLSVTFSRKERRQVRPRAKEGRQWGFFGLGIHNEVSLKAQEITVSFL